mgnify:CR=1 FL=1
MPTTPMKNNLYRLGLILFAPSVATQQVLFRYREDETLPLSPDYGPGRLFKRHHMLGGTLLLDDGKLLVEVTAAGPDALVCTVLRGGVLQSRKSIAAPGLSVPMPTLTSEDLANLRIAASCGVTGVMLPFVRGKQDILALRQALAEAGAPQIRIFAKIENLAGVQALPEFLSLVDEVVIARGDLGNAMPLWELPRCQKQLSAACRAAGVPFMVVTQMLDSMCTRAVPTRAEVSDIYNAVLDGASSLMLTGETAAGQYPVQAMEFLVRTASTAL